MTDLLFLSHRIPYPPEKGDKIRSWNMLRHLASGHRVHLGCFHDDPADARHIDALKSVCASVLCLPLNRMRAKAMSLTGLLSGLSLSQVYFRSRRLQQWVGTTMREKRVERIFVFGSAMAPYAMPYRNVRRVMDMVDVDSEKWRAYAASHAPPLAWLYALEGRRLLDLERVAAREFDWTLLVSAAETELFHRLAPESESRVIEVRNGVDIDYFDPGLSHPSPFPADAVPIVFTGAMDYWPNVEAVEWFAREVMPLTGSWIPAPEFWIVGANPTAAVSRLAQRPRIRVTGWVDDVRPYLAHAAAVVAPLHIAPGIQNKVLEAMAMAKPVVATAGAASGILEVSSRELIVADNAAEFARGIGTAMGEEGKRLGRRARALVEERFKWQQSWTALDRLFEGRGRPIEPVSERQDGDAVGLRQSAAGR